MLAIPSLALGQASTVNDPVYNVLTAYGQSCNDACDVFDLSCVSLPFSTSIPNIVGNPSQLTALTLATNPPVNCTNLKFSESYGIGMPRVELNGNDINCWALFFLICLSWSLPLPFPAPPPLPRASRRRHFLRSAIAKLP